MLLVKKHGYKVPLTRYFSHYAETACFCCLYTAAVRSRDWVYSIFSWHKSVHFTAV